MMAKSCPRSHSPSLALDCHPTNTPGSCPAPYVGWFLRPLVSKGVFLSIGKGVYCCRHGGEYVFNPLAQGSLKIRQG